MGTRNKKAAGYFYLSHHRLGAYKCPSRISCMSCYVCFEACDTLSPCLCKEMYLHDNCLETLRIYDHLICQVCKAPYPPRLISIEEENDEPDEFDCSSSVYWHLVPLHARPLSCRNHIYPVVELAHCVVWVTILSISMGILGNPFPLGVIAGAIFVYMVILSLLNSINTVCVC